MARVSGGEEQKVESSRVESRYLWLYYLLDVENFHLTGVDRGIHAVFVCFALKIRSGGRATPNALIHSIAIIHSYRPGIFLNPRVSSLLISTFEDKILPRANPDSSTLKTALGG